MKVYETLLGEVTLLSARIVRSSGYGQYSLVLTIEFEGEEEEIRYHSTDSELFDAAHGEDNHDEIVIEKAAYIIEQAINDYISSL